MHIYKTTSFTAIILAFALLFSACAGRKQTSVATPAKPAPTKSVAKTTPTIAPEDETPREKLIRLRGLEIEAQKELKKAEDEARKAQSPAMKKAEKEISAKEKAQRKAEREMRNLSANVQIAGCPAGTVWVNPKVSRGSLWVVESVVRVTNANALTVDIDSPRYGEVVRNLCPGGSVTIYFVIDIWFDSDSVQIPLTATARPEDGGLAMDTTSLYLNKYNIQYNRVDNRAWEIHLSRRQLTR